MSSNSTSSDDWRNEFRETVQRHCRQGFGWRYGQIDQWTTDAILSKLRAIGIDIDLPRFVALARSSPSCKAIHKQWGLLYKAWEDRLPERPDIPESFWADFPMYAAEELWRRLTPDRPCPELLAHRMDAVIERGRSDPAAAHAEGLATALAVVEYLQSLPPDQRADGLKAFGECGLNNYREWLDCVVWDNEDDHPEDAARLTKMLDEAAKPTK
jgi:hypothetical protein